MSLARHFCCAFLGATEERRSHPSTAGIPGSGGSHVTAHCVADVSCAKRRFLEARIELNEQRLIAIDPTLDVEIVRSYLAAIPIICAGGEQSGPIGQLPQRERFHWLVAPRSTIIQTSRVHTGFCQNPATVLDRLLDAKVRPPQVKSSAVEMTDVGMKQAIHFLSVTAPTVGMEKLSTSPHKED